MRGIAPSSSEQRSRNELRPDRLADVIGQTKAKALLERAVESCYERKRPMNHVLLVGPAGTGKTTMAHAVANELGVDVFDVEAPVTFEMLLELQQTMQWGDILKIEEIHQQAVSSRGGGTQPEVLYAVMEDKVLPTPNGILPFPEITIIGTTTDEGLLPDAFVSRFPLQPRLVGYDHDQLVDIVSLNADKLDLRMTYSAIDLFATACRGVPRQINNFMKTALVLTPPGELCNEHTALGVLDALGVTDDGLSSDMQAMLTFLYTRGERRSRDGEIRYQASVSTIATGIGKSRDVKAINLRVEPYLIQRGYVQVAHGGRVLTDAGTIRAQQLLGTL